MARSARAGLLLLLAGLLVHHACAFYLPGVAPQDFRKARRLDRGSMWDGLGPVMGWPEALRLSGLTRIGYIRPARASAGQPTLAMRSQPCVPRSDPAAQMHAATRELCQAAATLQCLVPLTACRQSSQSACQL